MTDYIWDWAKDLELKTKEKVNPATLIDRCVSKRIITFSGGMALQLELGL